MDRPGDLTVPASTTAGSTARPFHVKRTGGAVPADRAPMTRPGGTVLGQAGRR
jgi:hypothetical protein